MMYGYYPHAGLFGLGFGFGWILTIIFWALVIWAIVAFVRGGKCWDGRCGYRSSDSDDSATKILRERYAKGEINQAEFEAKMKDLGGKIDTKK